MPARHFSGDLVVAASRGPKLYAMLADATGHGLAAALSALPALTAFYRGAREGLPLVELAAEINDALVATLPVGRFVGAALLCLHAERGTAELWVGGVPEVWLLDEAGGLVRRFESRHLPLGIVRSHEMSCAPETIELRHNGQIVMCSDGVLEALSRTGADFGPERLQHALAAAKPERRLHSVQSALTAHLNGSAAHDDMSVLIVDCR